MKISECTNAPQWLKDAITSNADVEISVYGWVNWRGGDFLGGNFRGGDFRGDFLGGSFRGGNVRGNFLGGDFLGGNFLGGDFLGKFLGGDFLGGNFRGDFLGGKVKGNAALKLRAYKNLYSHQVTAALLSDGTRWIQMGCLWKSLEEWDKIGIRKSNLLSYPDDGSERSEERVAAFEFAKAAALRMKA